MVSLQLASKMRISSFDPNATLAAQKSSSAFLNGPINTCINASATSQTWQTVPQIYAPNTQPTVVAAYLEVLGDLLSCKEERKKLWKTSVCAWLRTTFRLLATLFFLHCYKVFMIHLFTNMHPDAVFEQHFTFSKMTKTAEQKRSLVW